MCLFHFPCSYTCMILKQRLVNIAVCFCFTWICWCWSACVPYSFCYCIWSNLRSQLGAIVIIEKLPLVKHKKVSSGIHETAEDSIRLQTLHTIQRKAEKVTGLLGLEVFFFFNLHVYFHIFVTSTLFRLNSCDPWIQERKNILILMVSSIHMTKFPIFFDYYKIIKI